MKKLIIGIGIVKYNNGEEIIFKIFKIGGSVKKDKHEIYKLIYEKFRKLTRGKFKPKLTSFIVSGKLNEYCSILDIKRNNRIYFGVGFDSHQIGAEIKAGIFLAKKMDLEESPRVDSRTMVIWGKIIHKNEIDSLLIN